MPPAGPLNKHATFWSEAVQLVESITIIDICIKSIAKIETAEFNRIQTVTARRESRNVNYYGTVRTLYDIHLTASDSTV